MKKKPIAILMIDDHPSIIEGYKSILSFNNLGLEIITTPAYTCASAYHSIVERPEANPFDFAFVDLSLPPYPEQQIKNGEDLALLIKNKFPLCKIVVLTSHAEAFILDSIIKNIDPIGLLVKSDFSANEFLISFEKMYKNFPYTSKTVVETTAELHQKSIFLDELNRKIITLLASGVKTKSLPDQLKISISTIDKRKAQIRHFFEIEVGTDEDIVLQAKKHGLI